MGNEILIVDDNPTNLKLARVLLEDEGYEVATAVNAAEVFTYLEHSTPRMIMMDIQLPDIDGLEVTRRLKADARYRDVIIVALTAYAMKGDHAKALAAGCDEYVTKPIDIDALAVTIAALLKA